MPKGKRARQSNQEVERVLWGEGAGWAERTRMCLRFKQEKKENWGTNVLSCFWNERSETFWMLVVCQVFLFVCTFLNCFLLLLCNMWENIKGMFSLEHSRRVSMAVEVAVGSEKAPRGT